MHPDPCNDLTSCVELRASAARTPDSRGLWLTADAGLQVFKRTLMSAALAGGSAKPRGQSAVRWFVVRGGGVGS